MYSCKKYHALSCVPAPRADHTSTCATYPKTPPSATKFYSKSWVRPTKQGWVKATHPQTSVRVYNFNTDSTIEVIAQTPNAEVNYTNGDFRIDGVPGTGSPILMNFSNIEGGATGKLFPTGNIRDTIDGVEVTVIDIGNLMMLVKAPDLGLRLLRAISRPRLCTLHMRLQVRFA